MKITKFIKNGIVILSILLFASCGNNHEKIAKKMLSKYNEPECKNIISNIESELAQEKYYKWNGTKCVLSVEGDLETEIDKLIEFHQSTHNFKDKKNEFNQKEWDNWIYYYNHSDEIDNVDVVRTDCFICWEKIGSEDFDDFENNLVNSKEELIYNSFYGSSVRKLEDKFTELYKEKQKIEWMSKCSVILTDYIYGSTKTVNQLLNGLPEIVTVEKETDGNSLIVKAFIMVDDEKVINLESTFQCVKASSNCYCMESNFTYNGQTASGKVYGNVYSDPEGAGYCLSLLCKGIDILKVFDKKNFE